MALSLPLTNARPVDMPGSSAPCISPSKVHSCIRQAGVKGSHLLHCRFCESVQAMVPSTLFCQACAFAFAQQKLGTRGPWILAKQAHCSAKGFADFNRVSQMLMCFTLYNSQPEKGSALARLGNFPQMSIYPTSILSGSPTLRSLLHSSCRTYLPLCLHHFVISFAEIMPWLSCERGHE